jgi:hypothetical protein
MSKIWGPKYWEFFHTISNKYPDNPTEIDKKKAKRFLDLIGEIIPCGKCAQHYRQNYKNFPIKNNLDSRKQFVKWFIDFHNIVNDLLKKKIIPYDKAIQKINNFSKKNIITQFDNVLKFAIHIIPEKGFANIRKRFSIQKFVNCSIHLCNIKKINKKKNINTNFKFVFKDRISYKKSQKRLIVKLRQK